MILCVKNHSEAKISANKTKIMKTDKTKIKINDEELENVNKFEYLGSMLAQ